MHTLHAVRQLGMKLVVHPDAWLVHLPHEHSAAQSLSKETGQVRRGGGRGGACWGGRLEQQGWGWRSEERVLHGCARPRSRPTTSCAWPAAPPC